MVLSTLAFEARGSTQFINIVTIMNKILESFARDYLKENLLKVDERSQDLFRRMYSHNDLTKPLDEVVNSIDSEKLDWAMVQVYNTLNKEKTTMM